MQLEAGIIPLFILIFKEKSQKQLLSFILVFNN